MTIRRSDDNRYTLLSNGSATGAAVSLRGGEYLFTVDGIINGATIALQIQTPNGTWSTVSIFNNSPVQATMLPYDQTSIVLPAANVRCAINGGAPSGINASLVGLG